MLRRGLPLNPSAGSREINVPQYPGNRFPAKPPGTGGVTLFAAVLILSPLLQWLYLTALSQFTLLEPPFAQSSGLVLAMQLFFAPGNVLGVVVGIGLLRRSERMRRLARVLFVISLALSAWHLGTQVAAWRESPNTLLSVTTLLIAATYFWYFGRPGVKAQFLAHSQSAVVPPAAAGAIDAAPASTAYPRPLMVSACVEIVLGIAAAALTAHLWTTFSGETLLDGTALSEAPAGEELLRMFLFVVFALLLSPHLLTGVAGAGILLGRATTSMARRYSLVACWTVIGCLLLTVWLVSHPELAFDVRNLLVIGAFCVVSLAWHLCFLYVLARFRPSSNATATAGRTLR